ncbi:hypothetical protein D9M69_466150 [compost metagenome]
MNQLATQLQALLVKRFEPADPLPLLHGSVVLLTVGIHIGEGLVPLLLEVDARVRKVSVEDLQQVVLHLLGLQLVQAQSPGEYALEYLGMAGLLQTEHREFALLASRAPAIAIHHAGELGTAETLGEQPATGQMAQQLRLCNQTAVIAPVIIHVQLPAIGKVLVVVADTLADATQHHTARLRQQHLHQDVGAVVREIETSTALYIVRTKIHPPSVNDE